MLLIILIKDIKKKKVLIKENEILIDFHTEETINTDEKNDSTEELSLKCPVPGYKFDGFAKFYDQHQTRLTERLITNNGNHDAMLAPSWNWIDWNYGERRGRKISIKVAIITHFTKIQQIDEFPALLNVDKDNGYSLGSQTDHYLCYVPIFEK